MAKNAECSEGRGPDSRVTNPNIEDIDPERRLTHFTTQGSKETPRIAPPMLVDGFTNPIVPEKGKERTPLHNSPPTLVPAESNPFKEDEPTVVPFALSVKETTAPVVIKKGNPGKRRKPHGQEPITGERLEIVIPGLPNRASEEAPRTAPIPTIEVSPKQPASPRDQSDTTHATPPLLQPSQTQNAHTSPEERPRIILTAHPHPETPQIISELTAQNTGGWKKKALIGLAAVAGFFGVKIGFEKAGEVAKENIEAASDAFDYFNGDVTAKMAEAGRAPFKQQPSEPPTAEQEPLTHTYIVQSGDSPWGLADSILESAGIDDPDGTLTLKAVKGLREKNNIQGDAARSKSMWVGQTLDLSPVYDLIASVKDPSSAPEAVGTKSVPSSKASLGSSTASPDTAHAQISPELAQHFSPELLSHTLNYPSETIWSRTHDILESLDVKPNMAKRGVLGAIVLADSHMSETQAMRVKYAGHKKFDVAKDTLEFTRAAQAALDLQKGMSPGDVAKKYGVKNVYEKLRDR